MTYIKNIWYVAAWSYEVPERAPIGRVIAGEPLVIYRQPSGALVALEDRCPHRHAPLSLGRVEGDDLRCMYHGVKLGGNGVCKEVPGSAKVPPRLFARTFPVVERSSWVWVWLGHPGKADPGLIPEGFGLENPKWSMRSSTLDYAADYLLVTDNLCDLSHFDFTHETTFGANMLGQFSSKEPRITTLHNGLQIERWLQDVVSLGADSSRPCDMFMTYQFLLPGIFLMNTSIYPTGTAVVSNYAVPRATPFMEWVDQQAVTPRAPKLTRYLYATGQRSDKATEDSLSIVWEVLTRAFGEDKRMIEAQQSIWDLTPSTKHLGFIPHDKAPAMFRKLVTERISEESEEDAALAKSW